MGVFSGLYDKVMAWSRHRHAVFYLAALSFAESSFFPVPPDVMLAPMSMAAPRKAVFYASLTTLASVAGGIAGYLIGWLAFEAVEPLIRDYGYLEKYLLARDWFDRWGFWAVFLAGFSPIPYKIFTITSGAIGMALLPFIAASAIGRGARFFMVASLMAWGGQPMENLLRRYVDVAGWALVGLVVVAVAVANL